ncbi:MAG: NACHT domain-containing NTPase, partial [Chitinophagales bacterium]
MENLYTFLFAISFLFILFVTAIVWIYYRYVKHTRERFAFFAVTALSGFMLSSIALLMVQSPFFNWLVEMHNQQLGTEYPPFQPDDIRFNATVLLFCNALLFALIRTLYFNWNGQKSTRQANKEDTQSKVSLLDDAQHYWSFVIKKKNTIEVYQGGESNTKREVFTEHQKDDRPWHEKAIDLLKLYDRQYDIDKEKDWHRTYKAYFGHYGEEGKRLGVLCVHGEPSAEELQVYLKKASELKGAFEAHIVLMEGMGRKKIQDFNGVAFQYRYEIELLNSLINFRDYKRTIIKDFEDKKLENSDLTLDDMYVPVGGEMKVIVNNKLQKEEDGDIESVEQFILDWAKDETANEKEHLAILGDYGQGKTVLTKKIVKEMLQNPNDYQRLPILIELRGLSPRNEDAISILGKWTNRFGGDANALWELHKAGELLIILDGFDEMDLVGDTEVLFSHFSQMWTLASVPKSKIIITGRPNLFADDAERREALGLVEPRTSL